MEKWQGGRKEVGRKKSRYQETRCFTSNMR